MNVYQESVLHKFQKKREFILPLILVNDLSEKMINFPFYQSTFSLDYFLPFLNQELFAEGKNYPLIRLQSGGWVMQPIEQ